MSMKDKNVSLSSLISIIRLADIDSYATRLLLIVRLISLDKFISTKALIGLVI